MTLNDVKHEFANWRLTLERIINLSIGMAALLIYEFLARPIYRPFIYQNNINDFHVADTLGNTLGTLATIFILIGIIGKGRIQHIFLIKTITISLVFYELLHPLLGKPIDPWDVVATMLTGGLSLILYTFIHPSTNSKN